MHKHIQTLSVISIIFVWASMAVNGEEVFVSREEAVLLSDPCVTVPLDDLVNDRQEITFPSRRITASKIPFDVLNKEGNNTLFLRDAQWPNWKSDPAAFNSPYDYLGDTRGKVRKPKDTKRPFFQIPVADYECLYLLAAADDDPKYSQIVTFRIGAFDGFWRKTIRDLEVTVPRAGDKTGKYVVRTIPTGNGNLFLMRIPMGFTFAQDFPDRLALDVEVTKKLQLAIRRPDPCRYQKRPLGLASGVRLYGITFWRSSVQMQVESSESAHVFNEPQVPTFQVQVRNVSKQYSIRPYTLEAAATAYDGTVTTVKSKAFKLTYKRRDRRIELPVSVPKRGYYELDLTLKRDGKAVLLDQTHFALLAPDTRKHRDQSVWGTWDFTGNNYTPYKANQVGPLYVKAGLRYGMFYYSAEERNAYGIIKGADPAVKNAEDVENVLKWVTEGWISKPSGIRMFLPEPSRIMIFHEDQISGPHVTRALGMFTGHPDYRFNDEEKARFDTLYQGALEAARAVREHFPQATIYFGNGAPHLFEAFLQRGFPRELFDCRGNESMSGSRLPETQPLDFVANNSGLWMDRQLLDHYGYPEKPVYQCYEITYPNTNPGNLSLRTQAAYMIRHVLHSMAWKVPVIRVSGISDVGNSYYHSNWGASGLCFGLPDLSPKPSYVAVATMTQVLDGSKFSKVLPCSAPSVYALAFTRPDGRHVTCMWTIRGKRPVSWAVASGDAKNDHVVDIMGNESPLILKNKQAALAIGSEPVFVVTTDPIDSLAAGPSVHDDAFATGKRFVISPLDDPNAWEVNEERNSLLEVYNAITNPRRKGDFTYRKVEEFEGMANVLEVKPTLPVPGPVYLPMYSELDHKEGAEIPGEPTEIGLLVNGNGGWGRVIVELEDASGQSWTSIGAEQSGEPTRWMADWMPEESFKAIKSSNLADWNTDDLFGHSYINFEGWRYMRFPLPGNYAGEQYHWPYSSQWRYSGDGIVKYPLTFKKLIVTIPEKVLKFTEYAPVPRQEIYLKDLQVGYGEWSKDNCAQ